ncbi:MAG: AAA family ATPase [Erysipelotrichaceae bacterium]|nr:AAA family ATPase [Erysipelotrichaceae bacterium]
MLKKFTVRNYKNFKDDLTIDFTNVGRYQFNKNCITNDVLAKMIIYGRNATGKTNLGEAIMDIKTVLFLSNGLNDDMQFLNADSNGNSVLFSYAFQFDEDELIYIYHKSSTQMLLEEELIINDISIFKCDFNANYFNFDNLKYIHGETANIERYKQSLNENNTDNVTQLPFMRWLTNNVAFYKDSPLIKLTQYVRKMIMIDTENTMRYRWRGINNRFYKYLEDSEKLEDLEYFLNIMGVECKLELKKLPDGNNELYFKHERLVPFRENASSGTLSLIYLYNQLFLPKQTPSFIYIDEFDAFYHYEMAENVIKFFKSKYPNCQMIMTSHNTNLMTNRIMRPDCLLILSRSGTLTSLCDATERELREGHNLEKIYISGEFESYE